MRHTYFGTRQINSVLRKIDLLMYTFRLAKVIVKCDVPDVCVYDGEIVRRANTLDIAGLPRAVVNSKTCAHILLRFGNTAKKNCSPIAIRRTWFFLLFQSRRNSVCKTAAAFRCRYGGKSCAKRSRRFAEIRTWARGPAVYVYATIIHYGNNVHVSENLS